MNVVIFSGPTLSPGEGRAILDGDYLPPAAQGDVFQAVKRYQPGVIGIIDGYFHRVPSVWHKEILWAMSEGVHVFGSASMGALRAAELHPFGMVGVGQIFEHYAMGKIVDDDEVAVIHGPAELGCPAITDAMVDIRATLHAAEQSGVISQSASQELATLAKGLFFQVRSYDAIIELAKDTPLPIHEMEAFHLWLKSGKVSQKKNDALEMLGIIKNFISTHPSKMKVKYFLEKTYSFDSV